MAYALLTLAFICNASANLLLKLAATRGFSFGAALRGQWTQAEYIALAAAVFFGLNLVSYLAALQRIPLSVGYPIMIGMTFVITTGAAFFLGEKLTYIHIVGLTFILLGLIIVARAAA